MKTEKTTALKVSPRFKWTYTKTQIQVVADDGVMKPGFIAPELVCFTAYGEPLGSVDLPDEYNSKEMYPCRVMLEGVAIKNKFACVKEAMEWVESNAKPLKTTKRKQKVLFDDAIREEEDDDDDVSDDDVDTLFREKDK
jgi:hypothetical protein